MEPTHTDPNVHHCFFLRLEANHGLSAPMNGSMLNLNDDLDEDDKDLSPPPDTPEGIDWLSIPSSHLVHELEDEIVVGSGANANPAKSSPHQAGSDTEELDMDDLDDDQPLVPHTLKRKRGSLVDIALKNDVSGMKSAEMAPRGRSGRPPKAQDKAIVKGVLLGIWRESDAVDEEDKHTVVGFMDARDRLRTRIQTINKAGQSIAAKYPIPPGPGGSWVTFDKIVFDDHLVNLDHHQVKEYIRIRFETQTPEETPEEKEERDKDAVRLACQRVLDHPPSETTQAVQIAYGKVVPETAQVPNRPEKRRRLAASATPNPVPDNLPGTRPTRILLGHWKQSSAAREEDKHAVYGILGANDMFRVKLMRESRDGKVVGGNFPNGPGALWIHWDDVDFDPHLRPLSRAEVKEYCRVRQRQMDLGEAPEDRRANEMKAVAEAQQRVTHLGPLLPTNKDGMLNMNPLAAGRKDSPAVNGNGPDDDYSLTTSGAAPHEPRQSRRDMGPRPRLSYPDADLRTTSRPGSDEALERTNSIARREVARVEAAQIRADMRAANTSREGSFSGNQKTQFQDNLSRLNKVWAAQEANRLKADGEGAKIYMGIKYERKQNGPFEGKLVSQGTIISIDGEDYVEYRVLTKPSFF